MFTTQQATDLSERLWTFANDNPIEQINDPAGRYYLTKEGNRYISVTTMLGAVMSKRGLKSWKERVGEAEAERIRDEAALRGTKLHKFIEAYFETGVVPKNDETIATNIFHNLKEELNKIVPIANEYPLWSPKLELAGTTDCVGFYDGVLSIIDFKSSEKFKKADWISSYFMQTTIYSMMLYEILNISAKQIVILIGLPDNQPQVFQRHVRDFIPLVLKAVRHWEKRNEEKSIFSSPVGRNPNLVFSSGFGV